MCVCVRGCRGLPGLPSGGFLSLLPRKQTSATTPGPGAAEGPRAAGRRALPGGEAGEEPPSRPSSRAWGWNRGPRRGLRGTRRTHGGRYSPARGRCPFALARLLRGGPICERDENLSLTKCRRRLCGHPGGLPPLGVSERQGRSCRSQRPQHLWAPSEGAPGPAARGVYRPSELRRGGWW